MAPYTKLNVADVEDVAPGYGLDERWEARVATTALDAEQTGVSHFRLKPGKRSPFAHRHDEAEEVYLVLSGSGRAKLGEEVVDVAALDAIRVAPELSRAFEAGPDGLEFLAFGPRRKGDGAAVEDDWVA